MTTTEIKRKLISQISRIEDKKLLEDIYSLVKDESKREVLVLTDDQLAAIDFAEKQIAAGLSLTDAEVRKRTAQWLGK